MHLSHFPPVPPSTESETLNKQTSTSVSQCWEWNLKQANQYLCLPVLRVKPQTSEPVLFSPSSKSETSNKRKVQSTLLLVNHCRLGTNIWKQYSSFSWYWNLSKWTWYLSQTYQNWSVCTHYLLYIMEMKNFLDPFISNSSSENMLC